MAMHAGVVMLVGILADRSFGNFHAL